MGRTLKFYCPVVGFLKKNNPIFILLDELKKNQIKISAEKERT